MMMAIIIMKMYFLGMPGCPLIVSAGDVYIWNDNSDQ